MGTYKLSYTGQEVNNILGTAKTLSAKVADLEGALDSLPSTPEGSPIAGIVYPFAGEVVPEGFLICDGEAYSRAEYAELFEAIGTTYGEGDGTSTFNIPDLQTRVPVGAGVDYELGEVGGEATHTLTIDEMPSHNHELREGADNTAGSTWESYTPGSGIARTATHAMLKKGGDQPHNNMQPYTVVNYIISTGKSADARPMTISETTVQSSTVAGMVYPFAGEGDPEGFLLCDGSEYSRTEYAKLFDAIGTTYGSGDGSTTFNVPNLESRVIIGESDGYVLGATGGEAEHTLTEEEMPSHTHNFTHPTMVWSTNVTDGVKMESTNQRWKASDNLGAGVTNTGGSQPHNNMQPYVVMRYFISTGEGGVVSGGSGSAVEGGIAPADYVVEYGNEGIWEWKKYASGIAECWGEWTGTYENEIAADGYDYVDVSLPAIFTERKPAHITPSYQAYRIDKVYDNAEQMNDKGELVTNVDYVRILVWADGSSIPTTATFSFSLSVKGLWKDSPASGGKAVGHFDNATVENDLEVGGTLSVNGREYGVNKVLASTASYMNADQTITLSEPISSQLNGIVLVWSWYDEGAKNWDWVHKFIPKHHLNISSGGGVDMFAIDSGGNAHMAKYVYVTDTQIVGHSRNGSGAKTLGGLTVNNGNWVLRYVIGV